jgi:hypothetical protein
VKFIGRGKGLRVVVQSKFGLIEGLEKKTEKLIELKKI